MEFSMIISQAYQSYQKGIKVVLATIVHLEGSSYRGEGTRMLLSEDGQMTFALSGGCIEMEVFKKAQTVFSSGVSKLITYDGRIRLGCEGLLYILLEPIFIDQKKNKQIKEIWNLRNSFVLTTYYEREDGRTGNFGTILTNDTNTRISISNLPIEVKDDSLNRYQQEIHPPFKLLLIGSGHDVNSLNLAAKTLGWKVVVVLCNQSPKTKVDFPQADECLYLEGEALKNMPLDQRTAAVIMTHNYDKDYHYAKALLSENLLYIGMIGSVKRKSRLKEDLMKEGFGLKIIDSIFTPAGLNLGAVTPEEIAISIIAEILAILKNKNPDSLKYIKGSKIHITC